MKNTFAISQQEERRIRRLHESYKDNFGTGNVIKEQGPVNPYFPDSEISDYLKKISQNLPIDNYHIKLVEEGIKCGHKPSAKCKMGTWAQDDECVRESLMAIIGSEGIIACVGKSIGQSVKDMISHL